MQNRCHYEKGRQIAKYRKLVLLLLGHPKGVFSELELFKLLLQIWVSKLTVIVGLGQPD